MIKTVIFDIGNVLVDFQWRDYFKTFGFSEEIQERLAKATVLSKNWGEFDKGILTSEEVIALFVENDPDIREEIYRAMDNLEGMIGRYDYARPWIQELQQKGMKVLVLSNFSQKGHRECAKALDFLEDVDGGILSYQEKLVKPMPAIYQLLLDRYQLIGEECVFLDDLQENLDGAAAFGIHTIRFTNREAAAEELRNLVHRF